MKKKTKTDLQIVQEVAIDVLVEERLRQGFNELEAMIYKNYPEELYKDIDKMIDRVMEKRNIKPL